jgi:type VI secretion system protein VasD
MNPRVTRHAPNAADNRAFHRRQGAISIVNFGKHNDAGRNASAGGRLGQKVRWKAAVSIAGLAAAIAVPPSLRAQQVIIAPAAPAPAPAPVQPVQPVQPAPAAPGVQVYQPPATPGVPVYPGAPGVQVYQPPATPGVPVGPGAAIAPPAMQPPAVQPAPVQAAPAPPKPSVAEMSFVVGSDINPDLTGRPSPVIVRTYELKSATVFNSSDFFAMFDRDKEVLGGDLVARDEWALTPGNSRQALKNLQRDTRYVGVVAAFRDLDRARWRATTFVYPNQITRMEIKLDRNEVNIRLH